LGATDPDGLWLLASETAMGAAALAEMKVRRVICLLIDPSLAQFSVFLTEYARH
jgi:hypothetical protein